MLGKNAPHPFEVADDSSFKTCERFVWEELWPIADPKFKAVVPSDPSGKSTVV